uniref:Uncharacterized protein n=1 Tax=Solanum lycopersicum TaxID=4081 RepID=K4CZN4_SOLLC
MHAMLISQEFHVIVDHCHIYKRFYITAQSDHKLLRSAVPPQGLSSEQEKLPYLPSRIESNSKSKERGETIVVAQSFVGVVRSEEVMFGSLRT